MSTRRSFLKSLATLVGVGAIARVAEAEVRPAELPDSTKVDAEALDRNAQPMMVATPYGPVAVVASADAGVTWRTVREPQYFEGELIGYIERREPILAGDLVRIECRKDGTIVVVGNGYEVTRS